MKKEMDKLKSKIRTNKRITIFLFVLILVGIVAGSLFLTILSKQDQDLVKNYLGEYITNIQNNKIQSFNIFLNSFFSNFLIFIMIWLLGISIIGIPVILFFVFSQAFTLGFSIGSFFYLYKLKGMIFSLFYVFPHQILLFLALSILTMYALSVSMKMISAVFKRKKVDFKMIMGKYLIVFAISLVLLFLSACYESFLLPKIMKFIFTLIK